MTCGAAASTFSINKAFTAQAFDITTEDLGDVAQPGKDFYGIHASNGGRVMIFAVVCRSRSEGTVVGAVHTPGQLLGYKIGMIEFQRVRRASESALGSSFDLVACHDALLGQGAVPLSLLGSLVGV